MLNRGYLLKGETVEWAIDRIAWAAADRLQKPKYKEKFKKLIEKWWMSLSSPIWANMWTGRGLPISCFGVYIPDSVESITEKLSEVIMQTKVWGGTSWYFGELRGRGRTITDNGESSGSVSFMRLFDTAIDVVSQGWVRRGVFASYLDIDHPDIEEFLNIKDIWNPIQNLFTGVCVPDYWMEEMISWDADKRRVWARVLESRQQKGMPYIFFSDNVNKWKPEAYKDRKIYASNLCSEIALPSKDDESFVCCLSSMNVELYDEWKWTDAVKYATYFLDAVMSEFIDKTKDSKFLKSAHNFAKRHRALGLWALGYHSYLQKNMIPFESFEAKQLNSEIFQFIKEESYKASGKLAQVYGEPSVMKWLWRRNTTLMAIAPTTSSSSILGQTSPSIEPYSSNYYKVGLAKGNFIRKNKFLLELLEEKWKNTDEVWKDIMVNQGSVQWLDFLTEKEKDVFKTFKEINPLEIVQQASIRQKFIDQAQSLNLNIPPDMTIKEVNSLLIEAWKLWVKTLYYQRSQSVSKDLVRNFWTCKSCEA